MGSGPLAQLLFYQYRSTNKAGGPSPRNASQRIAATDLKGKNREALATNYRLLCESAAQPRAEHRCLSSPSWCLPNAWLPQPREHPPRPSPPSPSPAEGGGGDRRRPRRSRGTLREAAAGCSALRSVEPRDRSLHTTQCTFAGLPADRHLDPMSTRLSLYPCQAVNKRGRIDPDRRPLRFQPIPSKPGKVVVQMVVYPPGITTCKPVRAWLLKASSEDTLSVLTGSQGIRGNPKTPAGQVIKALGSSGQVRGKPAPAAADDGIFTV